MPAARRKKTTAPEDVPQRGDPERKRVLNVLAQRRYRQRQREKIAVLEAQVKSPAVNAGTVGRLPEQSESSETISSNEMPLILDVVPSNSSSSIQPVPTAGDFWFPAINFDGLDFQLSENEDISAPSNPLSSTVAEENLDILLLSSPPSTTPESSTFPLSPDQNLTLPVLAALRAFTTIANLLNCMGELYNPFYQHTLPALPHPSLPPNLHPTPAQRLIPHHPLLDILPWPCAREKLVSVFALPSSLRPPAARDDGECGIVKMVYDLEDLTEGVRVHGNTQGWEDESELVEEVWEVGASFYKNWWWCLDKRVVEMTNKRRKARGQPILRVER